MPLRWKIAQWFELLWWKNYLSGKEKSKYLEWKKNYWKEILNKISSAVKIELSDTVADLGCGPAGIFITLTDYKVTAVDPLMDEYEKQISFFRKEDYPNATFVCCAMEDFGSQGSAVLGSKVQSTEVEKSSETGFDVVFCMNAINHV